MRVTMPVGKHTLGPLDPWCDQVVEFVQMRFAPCCVEQWIGDDSLCPEARSGSAKGRNALVPIGHLRTSRRKQDLYLRAATRQLGHCAPASKYLVVRMGDHNEGAE